MRDYGPAGKPWVPSNTINLDANFREIGKHAALAKLFFTDLFAMAKRPTAPQKKFLVSIYRFRQFLVDWVEQQFKVNKMECDTDLYNQALTGTNEPAQLKRAISTANEEGFTSGQKWIEAACSAVFTAMAKHLAKVTTWDRLVMKKWSFIHMKLEEAVLYDQSLDKFRQVAAATPELAEVTEVGPAPKQEVARSWKQRPEYWTPAWARASIHMTKGSFEAMQLPQEKVDYWTLDPPFNVLEDDAIDTKTLDAVVDLIDRNSKPTAVGDIYCSRDGPGTTYHDWVERFRKSQVCELLQWLLGMANFYCRTLQ